MTVLLATSMTGVAFGAVSSQGSGPSRAAGPIVWGCLAILVTLVERRRARRLR